LRSAARSSKSAAFQPASAAATCSRVVVGALGQAEQAQHAVAVDARSWCAANPLAGFARAAAVEAGDLVPDLRRDAVEREAAGALDRGVDQVDAADLLQAVAACGRPRWRERRRAERRLRRRRDGERGRQTGLAAGQVSRRSAAGSRPASRQSEATRQGVGAHGVDGAGRALAGRDQP
jgi:hypothetical protein